MPDKNPRKQQNRTSNKDPGTIVNSPCEKIPVVNIKGHKGKGNSRTETA